MRAQQLAHRLPSTGSDMSYLNARLRGWRARLFKSADYDAFVEAASMDAFMHLLEPTVYGPDIVVAGARFDGAYDILKSAIRTNLVRQFGFIWANAPLGVRGCLKAIFSTWEVYNIKALLRGIDKGVGAEELFETLVPVGETDHAALKELVGSKDVQDMLGLLHTWGSPYAVPLSEGSREYVKHHSLVEMEMNLDVFIVAAKGSSAGASSDNARMIRAMGSARVDALNIMTLMKAAGEGDAAAALEGLFIPGGSRLSRAEFLRLAEAATRDELLGLLPDAVRDASWRAVLYGADIEQMGMLEERFEYLRERAFSRESVVNPLSIALAAGFIYAKIRELKNLRVVARGKLFTIPGDVLSGLIIL